MAVDSQVSVVHLREPFHRGFGDFVTQTWRSRAILRSFVRKELKLRYRESILGVLWALVKPLTQLFVYGVVLGLFLGFGHAVPYYPLYVLTGLILWGIFAESCTQGATSIRRGAPLVKKIAFRREMLPLAAVGGALINAGFQAIALCFGYLITRTHPNWTSLGYLVPALLIVVSMGTAAALVLGAANVYLRDVQLILEVGLMVGFWMTPILYSWHAVQRGLIGAGLPGWLFDLYMLNPLAGAVVAFRQALWPGEQLASGEPFAYYSSPLAPNLWLAVLISLACVWVGQRLFARLQGGFAAEL